MRQHIIMESGLTNVKKPMWEAGLTNARRPSHLHALSVLGNYSILIIILFLYKSSH